MSENENSPATKQDIADLRNLFSAIAAETQAREERIAAAAQAREERIVETMRDIETHLVKEFINFVRSNDERLRAAENADAHNANRLATLEMRVTELELKLLRIN
jgi:hypothetical protein